MHIYMRQEENETRNDYKETLDSLRNRVSSGPIDVVERVSEKSIEGRKVKNGLQEYYRVVTLDVKNAFNHADWEQIMAALQQNQENTRHFD